MRCSNVGVIALLKAYFRGLYLRTMREAYARARTEMVAAMQEGGECLDCGANAGDMYDELARSVGLLRENYHGVEWSNEAVLEARRRGLDVIEADLNFQLPFESENFTCIFGLSVLEHLLNPCTYLRECHRALRTGGTLILLTPNISTYFTAALILAGKMPSSGPHPDSSELLGREELFHVSNTSLVRDAEASTPVHRHLVVFSFTVLRRYLDMLGFSAIRGYGFGLYPFPNAVQPLLERIDPYHCHQMVFVARK